MITRIELTNFMSHVQTVIEPAAGLTVLVGPNNCGKSAIVAALQILSSNENSTYVLRHGAKECSVKVETDDGHVVEWRRKNSPSYVIDGKLFDRLRGSGLPSELHEALRLPKVDAGDNTDFDVHFGTQKSPIFLLSGSASSAARFFASSSDAIRLVAMQRLHKEKFANAVREKTYLETESKEVNSALETLEPVVEFERRLAAARDLYDEILELTEQITAAEESDAELCDQGATVRRFSGQVELLRHLTPPPEIAPVEPLDEALTALDTAQKERRHSEMRSDALSSLPSPPELAETTPLDEMVAALVAAHTRWLSAASRAEALLSLEQPPAMTPFEVLQAIIQDIDSEKAGRHAAQLRTNALQSLLPPPELTDATSLERSVNEIAALTRQRQNAEAESRVLAVISSPPDLAEVRPLAILCDRLAALNRELAFRKQLDSGFSSLDEPPALSDEAEIAIAISELAAAMRHVEACEQLSWALAAIEPVPSPVDTIAVIESIARLEHAAANRQKCEAAARSAANCLAEASAHFRSKVDGSQCPICGSVLDADRLIARAELGQEGHDHG